MKMSVEAATPPSTVRDPEQLWGERCAPLPGAVLGSQGPTSGEQDIFVLTPEKLELLAAIRVRHVDEGPDAPAGLVVDGRQLTVATFAVGRDPDLTQYLREHPDTTGIMADDIFELSSSLAEAPHATWLPVVAEYAQARLQEISWERDRKFQIYLTDEAGVPTTHYSVKRRFEDQQKAYQEYERLRNEIARYSQIEGIEDVVRGTVLASNGGQNPETLAETLSAYMTAHIVLEVRKAEAESDAAERVIQTDPDAGQDLRDETENEIEQLLNLTEEWRKDDTGQKQYQSLAAVITAGSKGRGLNNPFFHRACLRVLSQRPEFLYFATAHPAVAEGEPDVPAPGETAAPAAEAEAEPSENPEQAILRAHVLTYVRLRMIEEVIEHYPGRSASKVMAALATDKLYKMLLEDDKEETLPAKKGDDEYLGLPFTELVEIATGPRADKLKDVVKLYDSAGRRSSFESHPAFKGYLKRFVPNHTLLNAEDNVRP